MTKANFCRELGQFLSENVPDYEIDQIIYKEDDNAEYAYIIYNGGAQKRINISCNSNWSIMKDILNKLNDTDYLMPSQRITI